MELLSVKKEQYKGYYQKWNTIDFGKVVDIPEGKYFKNGRHLIVAFEIRPGEYSDSSKHSYLFKNEADKVCGGE